jgi:methylmalonyl-CoA/ethylmalonyl-CoA epimerase
MCQDGAWYRSHGQPVIDGLAALAELRAPGTAAVHQVGVVVADLDAAVAAHSNMCGCTTGEWRFDTFGRDSVEELTVRGEPAAFSMRLAFHGSAPELELIEPLAGPSIYAEWLAAGAGGLHHLAVAVTSLERATAAMERAGFATLQAGYGFAPAGRGGFAYFDTAASLGYVIEAVELP